MKRDAIERLAIDSAAGELNEDAQALFRTYLTEHPRANKWAEDMLRIYGKTHAAIDAKIKTADVGIKGAVFKARPLSKVKWLPVVRWAAVLILGSLIGFKAGRWEITDKTYRIVLPEPSSVPRQVKTISDFREEYAGTFWGDKILALLEHRSNQQYKADFNEFRFWDRYRQYIKEKRYE